MTDDQMLISQMGGSGLYIILLIVIVALIFKIRHDNKIEKEYKRTINTIRNDGNYTRTN